MAASQTTNLNLNKPARTDFVSVVTDINDNMDIIDGAIGALPSGKTVQGQINELGTDKVPATREVNGKSLSSDVTLYGSDIEMNSGDSTKIDAAITALQSDVADLQETDEANYVKLDGIKANSSNLYLYKEAYGDIIEVDDAVAEAVKQMRIDIAPVQDLHGYSSPWVGGAGKNLCPGSVKSETAFGLTVALNTDGSFKVTGTYDRNQATEYSGSGYSFVLPAGTYTLSGTPTNTAEIKLRVKTSSTTIVTGNNNFTLSESSTVYVCMYVPTGASGVALPTDGLMFYPMVRSSSITDDTFAPYSNICPISGWTGANVTDIGTYPNRFNKPLVSGKNIAVSGIVADDNTRCCNVEYIELEPNTTYSVSYDGSMEWGCFFYNSSKTHLTGQYVAWTYANTFTTPATTAYGRFAFRSYTQPTNVTVIKHDVYSISFPSEAGTVYGSTLTVNQDGTGSLVVDRTSYTIPNTIGLDYSSSTKTYYFNQSTSLPANGTGTDYNSAFDGICDSLKSCGANTAWATATEGLIGWVNSSKLRFRLPTIAENDTASAIALLTGMQVVYKLATPVTYTLTTSQVLHLLSGYNTIYADCGDMTILYPSDAHQTVEQAEKERIHQSITTSDSVQTFTDGADNVPMGLKVGIEPVQDLHGYDHPWVGGAGKNLFNEEYPDISSESINYVAVNVGDGQFTLSTNCPLDSSNKAVIWLKATSGSVSTATDGVWNGQSRTVTSVSGKVYVYYKISSVSPVDYNVQLESGSSATSYSTYSNICPISGHTSANVTRTGKNLVIEDEITLYDKYIRISNGIADWIYSGDSKTFYIRVKPNTTYTVSVGNPSSNLLRVMAVSEEPYNGITSTNYAQWSTNAIKCTITTGENDKYLIVQSRKAYLVGKTAQIQIEENDDATTYEKSAGHIYNITFPSEAGTVYGGYFTIAKDGVVDMVVDHKSVTYDLSSSSAWSKDGSRFINGTALSDIKPGDGRLPVISNEGVYDASATTPGTIFVNKNSKFLYYYPPAEYTEDVTTFTTWLASNPIQILYELATPVTIRLNPCQIKSLLGVNNVWSDTGSIQSIEYSADIKTYIDNLFATIIPAEGVDF